MNRSAGILLPIFSLPSRYGIGCFDQAAYDFVDWLADAGQTYWQILPLAPTSYGPSSDSPYQSYSAFAGNPYFISLEALIEEGVLTKRNAMPSTSVPKHTTSITTNCTNIALNCCTWRMNEATSAKIRTI